MKGTIKPITTATATSVAFNELLVGTYIPSRYEEEEVINPNLPGGFAFRTWVFVYA